MSAATDQALVAWHDTECGDYTADLRLWRELAGRGSVLDIGAGTGRVALHLAAWGARVTALDIEPALLAELERRAARRDLRVQTVVGDAAGFDLGRRFDAILVPMQTAQLLPDAAARRGLLRSARAHLAPGGVLALAIVTDLEPFGPDDGPLPAPDVLERDGHRFESQPVAVRRLPGRLGIERLRRVDGGPAEHDAIELAMIGAADLEAEGAAAGLHPGPRRTVRPTPDHVGSEVVVLGG